MGHQGQSLGRERGDGYLQGHRDRAGVGIEMTATSRVWLLAPWMECDTLYLSPGAPGHPTDAVPRKRLQLDPPHRHCRGPADLHQPPGHLCPFHSRNLRLDWWVTAPCSCPSLGMGCCSSMPAPVLTGARLRLTLLCLSFPFSLCQDQVVVWIPHPIPVLAGWFPQRSAGTCSSPACLP